MSIIDQVAELRAELAGSILTKDERTHLEAELQAALKTLRLRAETACQPYPRQRAA